MIHKFKFENSNILMDIHSGAVHIVDEVAYEIVEDVLSLSKEDVVEKYKPKFELDEIEELFLHTNVVFLYGFGGIGKSSIAKKKNKAE